MAPMKSPARKDRDALPFDSYSLTHLAHRWNVSRRKVRQLLQRGELPFVQIAGQIRVPASAVVCLEREGKKNRRFFSA